MELDVSFANWNFGLQFSKSSQKDNFEEEYEIKTQISIAKIEKRDIIKVDRR